MTSVASVTSRSERLSPGALHVPAHPAAEASPRIAPHARACSSPAPDAEAALRLGLRRAGAWTAAGQAALARLDAALGGPVELTPAACRARALAWGEALGLGLARVEASSEEAALAFSESVRCVAPEAVRFVGADAWGRRLVLGEARPTEARPREASPRDAWPRDACPAWSLRLAPARAATLLHLCEADRWPLWLAAEQVRVLPLGAGALGAAEDLTRALCAAGLRASTHAEGTLGARVRSAGQRRVPALVLLGARELAEGRVTLRWRSGESLSLAPAALSAALLRAASWTASSALSPSPTQPTLGALPPSTPPGLAPGRDPEPASASDLAPFQAPHRR